MITCEAYMEKNFQAGWYYNERTDMKENVYLNCYTPVNIDKWFDRIQLNSEMKNLLLKIYQKIGKLEGISELLDKEELKNTDELIDRRNLMCCYMDENQLPDFAYFFGYASDNELILEERQKIKAFSDLRMLRRQHREKFIIHRQTIWVLRKEWNPTAPHRINDCLDDLIRIMSEFRSDLKKENTPLNPILFSGLLYYQLLTVVPYDRNNILYASYAVAKYLQELKVLPEISYPLTKLIYDNKNGCNDRMAEVRQACNINQWLLFYLDILDKTFGTEYSFIKEKHRCLDRSRDVLNKAKNIPNHMKERMKREMIMMYQKPVFRIEELMNDCDITHSTATKMVNLFIELKLVKQANDKQRYRKYSDLLGTLKKEVQKVKELQPEKYYICCALNLTAKNKRELYDMFSDYMESANDIMSLIDIDDFLECPENMDIVRKHYKLWLESTEILGEVFNQNVFIDCESLLYNIEEESRRFVETSCYYECLDILEKEKILLLLGIPGTGKTVTTKMLAIYYASKGYRIRYTTNGDISDIKNAISTQKDLPEIILLDDCLGQHYFRMKETQGNELLSLVKYVTCHKNKKLIMNSRVTIFQQAKEQVIE